MNDLIELKVNTILSKIMRVDVLSVDVAASSDTIVTWDSLNHMKLILALEEEFNLIFNEKEIEEMVSLPKISMIIINSLASQSNSNLIE